MLFGRLFDLCFTLRFNVASWPRHHRSVTSGPAEVPSVLSAHNVRCFGLKHQLMLRISARKVNKMLRKIYIFANSNVSILCRKCIFVFGHFYEKVKFHNIFVNSVQQFMLHQEIEINLVFVHVWAMTGAIITAQPKLNEKPRVRPRMAQESPHMTNPMLK